MSSPRIAPSDAITESQIEDLRDDADALVSSIAEAQAACARAQGLLNELDQSGEIDASQAETDIAEAMDALERAEAAAQEVRDRLDDVDAIADPDEDEEAEEE